MTQDSVTAGVSRREAEVLAALAHHLTNAEIAERLVISVRTVESHVSSLLRKLGAQDRRALAQLAAAQEPGRVDAAARRWPTPLTPFVGRAREREALTAALDAHRLVTAVGPGGVGKTRLAQVAALDHSSRRPDGGWYVDLVPVSHSSMVATAVADALGLGEQRGRSIQDTVVSRLADRDGLLVLDNCEHVVDGVVVLLERLLGAAPRMTVLATSRARLLVPYEWTFVVPGLSVDGDETGAGSGGGDAVELFLARASAAGWSDGAGDRARIAALCRGLDGIALAIELSAARLPGIGLHGLETGLTDRLDLLTGGRRVDERHRSLRSALDWSWTLLEEVGQAVLRRVSVFARPFTAADAADVSAGWAPVAPVRVAGALAGLADASLLVPVTTDGGMRYRALETIRQYAALQLAAAGEDDAVHLRHLRWAVDCADALAAEPAVDPGASRARSEVVADELRAALHWSAMQKGTRDDAYRVAVRLAELSFTRGMPGESQRRYEQAAALAGTPAEAAAALRCAAGAAETRHFGDEAIRLHRAAADAAVRAGDPAGAAGDLARIAEFTNRGSGLISHLPSAAEVRDLIDRAAALAGDDPVAAARVAVAEAYACPATDPDGPALTERAIMLARRAGAPLVECSALDQLMCIELTRGDVRAGAASTQRRAELLSSLPITAESGLEFSDGMNMAADTAVGAGDLSAARGYAELVRSLPFHREEDHLAVGRLMVVTTLTGDWDETVALADRYRIGWERAGRPYDGDLNRCAYAAATVFRLRGDKAAQDAWMRLVADLVTPNLVRRDSRCYETLDGLLLLHLGRFEAAVQRLAASPEECVTWHDGLWRPWHAAAWAEAAVLADLPDARDRVHRAGTAAADNPVTAALVRRAAALLDEDHAALLASADDLNAAGCRYQWARTLVLAGGADRKIGAAALAGMGACPTVLPARFA